MSLVGLTSDGVSEKQRKRQKTVFPDCILVVYEKLHFKVTLIGALPMHVKKQ